MRFCMGTEKEEIGMNNKQRKEKVVNSEGDLYVRIFKDKEKVNKEILCKECGIFFKPKEGNLCKYVYVKPGIETIEEKKMDGKDGIIIDCPLCKTKHVVKKKTGK